MSDFDSFTGLVWTLLGAVGGFSKVLVQLLGMEKLPGWRAILWLLMANSFVSGFAGFLGAIVMQQFTQSDSMHVVAAGISGYMGVAALDIFSGWFKSKVETKI